MKRREEHPTRLALIECGLKLTEQHGLHGFTVEMLLTESGISKGSLYHHFDDFIDLLETIQVRQYASSVDASIAQLELVMGQPLGREELRASLHAVADFAHTDANRANRIARARMIGATEGRDRFARLLGVEQDRLRDAMAALIANAQHAGIVQKHVSAASLATFILAYAQGLIVNDIAANPIPISEYVALVKMFVDRIIIEPA